MNYQQKYYLLHKAKMNAQAKKYRDSHKKELQDYAVNYYKRYKKVIINRSSIRNKTLEYRFWKRWHNMHERCSNTKSNNYHLWGGRGIKVSSKWKNFEDFKQDMWNSFLKHYKIHGGYNTTLDRVDTNKNYSPSNCKWSTMKEQQNNRRNNK